MMMEYLRSNIQYLVMFDSYLDAELVLFGQPLDSNISIHHPYVYQDQDIIIHQHFQRSNPLQIHSNSPEHPQPSNNYQTIQPEPAVEYTGRHLYRKKSGQSSHRDRYQEQRQLANEQFQRAEDLDNEDCFGVNVEDRVSAQEFQLRNQPSTDSYQIIEDHKAKAQEQIEDRVQEGQPSENKDEEQEQDELDIAALEQLEMQPV